LLHTPHVTKYGKLVKKIGQLEVICQSFLPPKFYHTVASFYPTGNWKQWKLKWLKIEIEKLKLKTEIS